MTDNEIMITLRRCADHACYRCTEYGKEYCNRTVAALAWDLMYRQKAEIERLEKQSNTFAKRFYKEGIKEFAERLATKIVNTPFGVNCSGETESYKDGCLHGLVAKQNNVLDMIYDLVKEMTEEQ